MELIVNIFTPISMVMATVLEAIEGVVSSYGLSIILLSFIVRLLLLPLSRWAKRIEQREAALHLVMKPQIDSAKAELRGRDRFDRIDEIYRAHGYHPISSLKSLSALALQIPFLLAALFLLADYPPIAGVPLGVISDLSQPDGLLAIGGGSLNLLPIALTLVAIFEAFLNPQATSGSRAKFILVALVVVVLIYEFPAAVCLYWLSSNVFSLTAQLLKRAALRSV